LCGLISAAPEKDDGLAGLLKVNAVTRTMGHSHFAHALSDRLHIAGIAEAEALDA
jgi:hypothetical protein